MYSGEPFLPKVSFDIVDCLALTRELFCSSYVQSEVDENTGHLFASRCSQRLESSCDFESLEASSIANLRSSSFIDFWIKVATLRLSKNVMGCCVCLILQLGIFCSFLLDALYLYISQSRDVRFEIRCESESTWILGKAKK